MTTSEIDEIRPGARDRAVFAADGEVFSWADVVAAARLRGSWRELQAATRHGLACERRLAASGGEIDQKEFIEASTHFRYARNLLSGDDLTAWLEAWSVTGPEWRNHVRHALLRERWAGELEETASRFPVPGAEVTGATWPEAACSGFLERAAKRLAGDVALAIGAGEALHGERGAALVRLHEAAVGARSAFVTAEAIEREVVGHRLEWLRVDASTMELETDDMAREAMLSIRADGRSLADVAADCGVQPAALSVLVGEVEGEMSSRLLAAREGDVLGPIPRDGAFTVLLIERKTPPDAADPAVRRRAEERLIGRAVEQAINRCVTWHESF